MQYCFPSPVPLYLFRAAWHQTTPALLRYNEDKKPSERCPIHPPSNTPIRFPLKKIGNHYVYTILFPHLHHKNGVTAPDINNICPLQQMIDRIFTGRRHETKALYFTSQFIIFFGKYILIVFMFPCTTMHYHTNRLFSGFLNMHNAVPICIIKCVFVANLLQKYKFVANICASISWDSFLENP